MVNQNRPLGGLHGGQNFPVQHPGPYVGHGLGGTPGQLPGQYAQLPGQYTQLPGQYVQPPGTYAQAPGQYYGILESPFGQQPPPTDPPLYGPPRYNEIQPSVPIKSRESMKSEKDKDRLSQMNLLLVGIGSIVLVLAAIIGAFVFIKKRIKRRTESNVYNFPSKSNYRNKPV